MPVFCCPKPGRRLRVLKKLFVRYRDIISYLFFGVCTTLINLIVYYACAHPFHLSTAVSTVTAWLLSVLFAFITNKLWVFESKSWKSNVVIREAASFFLCRLATGIMDLVIMLVSVDIFGWNDLLMKIISNVLVVIINYVASKLLIFRKKAGDKTDAEKE